MEFWLYDHTANTRSTLLVDGAPILIGRDEDCTIRLKGAFVARRHCRIDIKGNTLFAENLSRSALRVAGRDVMPGQPVRLDFGDELQIAQYSLALVRPGKQRSDEENRRLLQNRLVAFEQQVHAELIERLNLRITGQISKNDPAYVAQIVSHLNQILDRRSTDLDEQLMAHMVHMHLERLITAEVVRQCTGKVQTDYRTDSGNGRPEDVAAEHTLTETVASMVDMMPLILDPTSVQEDLAAAEEAFADLFPQYLPTIAPRLRQYLVRQVVAKDLKDIMLGLGPLQDLLEMANVTEIMVVGKDHIYVEKNGVIQPTTRSFFSDDVLMGVIERILTPVGRRVDQSSPLVDARLPDGSRVNVIIPPLSLVGPCITIRKFSWIPFTIDDLIERGSISEQVAQFLQGCVTGRKNIVISGGTGSGKTTLLNVLSSYIRPTERIITLEESAELQLTQPHVVTLEARPANIEGRGAYSIRDLVRNALRMRPDRIIVGEVRGAEALDMLQAMNTGHDGSLSTLHANTPPDAVSRLETMVLMAVDIPVRAIREQIVSAVDLIVQIARSPDGRRRVTHVSEVTEIDLNTGVIRLEDVFNLRDNAQPRLRHTGYIPTFTQEMIHKGLLKVDLFL
jgi:pilus assembly protein CpaF